MLSTHLSLAVAGGMTNVLLGQQASPLRNLLFRLIDSHLPQSIHEVLFYDRCTVKLALTVSLKTLPTRFTC
jgi:hypothetical protein